MKIQSPTFRSCIIGYLKELSDENYQAEKWVRQENLSPGIIENLDNVIDFMLNDYNVNELGKKVIGYALHSDEEFEAVASVTSALDSIIDKLGEVPDSQYVSDPDWKDVVRFAKTAYELLASHPQNESYMK